MISKYRLIAILILVAGLLGGSLIAIIAIYSPSHPSTIQSVLESKGVLCEKNENGAFEILDENGKLDSLKQLSKLRRISYVELVNSDLSDFSPLNDVKHKFSLRIRSALRPLDLSTLNSEGLKSIHIIGCTLTNGSLSRLKHCRNLETVVLMDCIGDYQGLSKLSQITELKVFTLHSPRTLGNAQVREIERLARLSRLRVLELAFGHRQTIQLNFPNSLESIELKDVNFEDPNASINLPDLIQFAVVESNLKSIDFATGHSDVIELSITSTELNSFSPTAQLPSLGKLSFKDNQKLKRIELNDQISSSTILWLQVENCPLINIKGNNNVHVLDLSDLDGLEQNLATFPAVEILGLEKVDFENVDFSEFISSLEKMQKLTVIEVDKRDQQLVQKKLSAVEFPQQVEIDGL